MFNHLNKSATKKIKDRGIPWKENYHEKSLTMKKTFEKAVGPKVYLRYEGFDTYSGCDYYVVIGPTVDEGRKTFFAGIKKMPKDPDAKVYSPYGEYFPSIKAAQAYAAKKWGVPFDQSVPDYKEESLAGADIPEHIRG